VNTPIASGWGSGSAPFALYVVRMGAGIASQNARSHLVSAGRQPSPASTTGRRAARMSAAARSSAASDGRAAGGGVMRAATGRASRPATSAGRSRCTGPRGSASASCTAWAIQWLAESRVTVSEPFTSAPTWDG
jgi:hypothetical protein